MLNPFEFKWARMASFIFNQIHANTDEAHHCSQPPASLLLFPTSLYCQTAVILGASDNSGMTHCYLSCYCFSSMCFSFQNWSLACSEWSCFWWTAVSPALCWWRLFINGSAWWLQKYWALTYHLLCLSASVFPSPAWDSISCFCVLVVLLTLLLLCSAISCNWVISFRAAILFIWPKKSPKELI